MVQKLCGERVKVPDGAAHRRVGVKNRCSRNVLVHSKVYRRKSSVEGHMRSVCSSAQRTPLLEIRVVRHPDCDQEEVS